jgi:hypothetical protein
VVGGGKWKVRGKKHKKREGTFAREQAQSVLPAIGGTHCHNITKRSPNVENATWLLCDSIWTTRN